jgi:hypothetical protein
MDNLPNTLFKVIVYYDGSNEQCFVRASIKDVNHSITRTELKDAVRRYGKAKALKYGLLVGLTLIGALTVARALSSVISHSFHRISFP